MTIAGGSGWVTARRVPDATCPAAHVVTGSSRPVCDDTRLRSQPEGPAPHVRTPLRQHRRDPAIAERIPPGQYRTEKFPVLHYGSVPRIDLATWDFKVCGEVDAPFTLTWDQFKALPRKQVHTDIHCVTRWSKLDTTWEGVADPGHPRDGPGPPDGDARRQPRRAGLHRQPAARGPR